ncbi:hypothetical protein L3X09_14800 [Enterococcus faecium]|nr:hypothetical protein [Enterococcus faecium]
MFGIPGWAIGALLTGASWTKKGASPGMQLQKNGTKMVMAGLDFITKGDMMQLEEL